MEQLSVLMFIRLPSVLIQYEKVCVSHIYSPTIKENLHTDAQWCTFTIAYSAFQHVC